MEGMEAAVMEETELQVELDTEAQSLTMDLDTTTVCVVGLITLHREDVEEAGNILSPRL